MTFVRIAWRVARKRFPGVFVCCACSAKDTSEENGTVEQWYVSDKNVGPYCPECARKLANATDSAHSQNTFFLTTRG